MSEIITLPCYHGRYGTKTFRNPVDLAEMVSWCDSHSHIWFAAMQGDARECKINGKVRTWKRDKNRVEVPVKYGLYEYGTFYPHDINRILIPVDILKCQKGGNDEIR